MTRLRRSTCGSGNWPVNAMLDLVLRRFDVQDGATFSADEVAQWPQGALDRIMATGLVREVAPADGLVCDQCEEACYITPLVQEDPRTGKPIGVFFCNTNEEVGRFTVDLERLRQWEACPDGLAQAVARALSTVGGVQEVVRGRVYWLGRIVLNGKSREVFLGRGLVWPDSSTVLGQAKRLAKAKAPVVLVPAVVPPEGVWNGRVFVVRPLTEVAMLAASGLSVAAAHLIEADSGGDVRKPRKMLRGWKDICEALGVPYDERRSLRLMNETQDGLIKSLGKGKKPEVWSDDLENWWHDQEARHEALRQKQASASATLGDSFEYGRKREIVIPKVSMHVRKRRKGQGRPRNDNH